MTFLQQKTQNWVNQHIITSEQQHQILKQEHHRMSSFGLALLFWSGILCILVGMVSILADNLTVIPGWLKVMGAVVALAACFIGTFYFIQKQKRIFAETGLFLSFFGIGALIGLLAQIFGIPLETRSGLLVWAAASVMIVMLSQKTYLSFLWVSLFVGGLLGYLKWEFLFLFFQQVPLATTLLTCAVLWIMAYFFGHFKNVLVVSIYRWLLLGYVFMMIVGDWVISDKLTGLLLFLILAGGLILLSVFEDKKKVFHGAAFLIVIRLVIFYFQIFNSVTFVGLGFLAFGGILFISFWIWKCFSKKESDLLSDVSE